MTDETENKIIPLSEKYIELIGINEDEGEDKYQYERKDITEALKNVKEDLDSGLFSPEYIQKILKKHFGEFK